jgi:hypothetical protein
MTLYSPVNLSYKYGVLVQTEAPITVTATHRMHAREGCVTDDATRMLLPSGDLTTFMFGQQSSGALGAVIHGASSCFFGARFVIVL